jgi:hypothetical protein
VESVISSLEFITELLDITMSRSTDILQLIAMRMEILNPRKKMKIEVSNGEIIDKLTIIQIKLERITDEGKRLNLMNEYNELINASRLIMSITDPLYIGLYKVNCELWDIEDRIRELERKKDFGDDFVSTARAVYFTNDKRSQLKREINIKTSSGLIEEKSYKEY